MTGFAHQDKKRAGQSAAELAIFGSIVIFVIGMILKTSLAVSHRSNIDLRVFRMALQESYRTALGEYSGGFSSGRNNSYIFLVEDRLSIDPSKKQGTRDRSPYIAQGNATMSINLFMDIDEDDTEDLSVYDIFINGQRFPFTISRVSTKSPQDMYTHEQIPDCTDNDYGESRGETVGACRRSDGRYYFFVKVYNGDDDWCSHGSCDGWSAQSRFDLDFDGTSDFDVETASLPDGAMIRDRFEWQWVRKRSEDIQEDDLVDIDGDWKEERILDVSGSGASISYKVLDFQDGNFDLTWDEGTEKLFDEIGEYQHKPGLQADINAYSFTHDGTMLRNEEGQLFNTVNDQFVRNTTAQDHLDIIERVVYLSGDTGRFCQTSTSPRIWSGGWAQDNGVWNMTNPVEACGDCFAVVSGEDHRKMTCLDTSVPVLFVRSRLRNRGATRWVTRTEELN